MTSRFLNNLLKFTVLVVLALFLPIFALAQDGTLTLSVSPVLFEMSAEPDQTWRSSIRVINVNPYELTVYPSVVNFEPRGEEGEGKFTPVLESEMDGKTMAEWISIDSAGITIPAEQTTQLPFVVSVPPDAAPGGHFAAILVSTRPQDGDGTTVVTTSQTVSSLFFLRIAGDINESGGIRSFRPADMIVSEPEATFELRFENKGNVHLQPQGSINIKNMWGHERGTIPINQRSNFGNVLPESIRKFIFTWKGESSIFDIGRYTAEVSLAYGQEGRQFASSETSFWIIPFKALFITLSIIIFFIVFTSWIIKLYVRRVLQLSGVESSSRQYASQPISKTKGDINLKSYRTFSAPMRAGMQDLRMRMSSSSELIEKSKQLMLFVINYRIFFAAVVVFVALILLFYFIYNVVTEPSRDYSVIINRQDVEVEMTAEEIFYQENYGDIETAQEGVTISVINRTDEVGVAAKVANELNQKGFAVKIANAELSSIEQNTVIIYSPQAENDALALSEALGGVLLSAFQNTEAEYDTPIVLMVGEDVKQ